MTRESSATVITIIGELDLSTIHRLTDCVLEITERCPDRVVLDMAQVSFFCADGLRALFCAQTTVAATGGELALRCPSACTRRVLTITGTDQLFGLDNVAADQAAGSSPP